MRRGTTPTLTVTPTVKRGEEVEVLDLSGYERVILTFKTKCGKELDVEKDRLAFDEGVIAVTLTQEETFDFNGAAEMQIRAVTDAGVAIASDIATVDFKRILLEEVIE